MGRITKLKDIVGIIKDKVSQSKAAMNISNPKTLTLHLSLLRATTHDPSAPPDPKHVATILSFGQGSRATAAAAIEALMDRLQCTRDSFVAVKCLVLVHRIVKEGSFILQDQLSVYPSTGGRNYLKLSGFRDHSSPANWEMSSWVRWYARYLEHLISTSRVMGFFLCSTLKATQKDREEEKVSSLTNTDLLKEIDSLTSLMEEITRRPDSLHLHGNPLVQEVMSLVGDDYLSAINDVSCQIDEFNHRLGCLSFGDSADLACVLKRLEDCKESLSILSTRKRALIEGLWSMVSELRGKVGIGNKLEGTGPLLLTWGRGDKLVSESTRFVGDQVLSYGNRLRFSSGRFGSNRFDFNNVMNACVG